MTFISNITASVVESTKRALPFYKEYQHEIILAVILGCGALLWHHLGHPLITKIINKCAAYNRRKKIISSLNELVVSYGTEHIDKKHFVAIELPNNTSQPYVVRNVRLIRDSRLVFNTFHDPKHTHFADDQTELTKTGVSIAPHGHGTWYYRGPAFISDHCPRVAKCQIDFEYSIDDRNILTCTYRSPDSKDKVIYSMFEMWWKSVNS